MSVVISASRLKEAAAWALRGIANRPAVPCMSATVLAVENGTLTASGWDWETLTRYAGEGIGDLERTLVNGRLLATIASKLQGDVTLEREGSRLVIRSGRSRTALDTMPYSEYPNLPVPNEESGVLDGFAELIGRVGPSAGEMHAQPTWLTGVTLQAAGDELSAVATDRYIVSHSTQAWTGGEFTVNIPARRLEAVARQMDGKVSIGVGNGISLMCDGLYASILATEDGNPNVAQYFDPKMWGNGYCDVDRDALAVAIDHVTPTVGEKKPVRLFVEAGEMVLKSCDQGVGESDDAVDCDLVGIDAFAIAISPAYLTKALDATPAEMVRIRFGTSARKPVLVHGLADGEPDLSTRHVVMPIRVNDI